MEPSADNDLTSEACRGTRSTLRAGFYRKAIANATEYRRAVGYFSASFFGLAQEEYLSFFERGGRIELVSSNQVFESDVKAIVAGIENTRHWLHVSLAELPRTGTEANSSMLSWAIAHNQMHVKVAVVDHNEKAVYHEKFGIFVRDREPFLCFEGSANETRSAMCDNFERVGLYWGDSPRALAGQRRLVAEFESLWQNDTAGLTIWPVYRALREGLINFIEPRQRVPSTTVPYTGHIAKPEMKFAPEILRLPERLVLHDYQQEAIAHWFKNNGRGILEMATGAGKTFTALAGVTDLYQKVGGPLVIIIVAPYIHLIDQWSEEAAAFGLSPIRCYGLQSDWHQYVESGLFRTNSGKREIFSLAVTNATFCTERFSSIVKKINVRTLLIADEVHNLGAAKLASHLPSRVSLRLGLSATPTRWRDRDGTDRLTDYFGPVVFRFGLKDALTHNPPVLVPYRYYPILVELDDDEQSEYIDLTLAIGRSLSDFDGTSMSELVKRLLIKRSRIIASARQKLPRLQEAIAPFRNMIHTLVYCGDSTVEFGDSDDPGENYESIRQM